MITPDDLFTEELNDEPLEVLQENDEQNPDVEDGNRGEDEAEEVSTVVKPKRIVRNPQPKLNEERLKGPKGLPAVEKHFEKVKYKGKGYEEQDLSTILKTYEYWCHRMFPKLPFDETIAKIEKLGSKKAVQSHIKRMRLGIELEDIDRQQMHVVSDEEDQPREDFDALLGAIEYNEPEEISEEQLERMRLNRERAERLKQERLEKARGMAQTCLEDPSSIQDAPGPSHQRTHNESSSGEEDIDMIFNKLNSSKENKDKHDGISQNANSLDSSEEEDLDTIFDKINSRRENDLDPHQEFSNPGTSTHGSHHENSQESLERVSDKFSYSNGNKECDSRMEDVRELPNPSSSIQASFNNDSSEEEEDPDVIIEKLNSNKENKPQNKELPNFDKTENAGELAGKGADEILHKIN